jgi:hypothetical protein
MESLRPPGGFPHILGCTLCWPGNVIPSADCIRLSQRVIVHSIMRDTSSLVEEVSRSSQTGAWTMG